MAERRTYEIKVRSINKCYVGSTAMTVAERYAKHLSLLRNGKHHAPKLQVAFDLCGESDLDVLDYGDQLTEQEAIDAALSFGRLLNGTAKVASDPSGPAFDAGPLHEDRRARLLAASALVFGGNQSALHRALAAHEPGLALSTVQGWCRGTARSGLPLKEMTLRGILTTIGLSADWRPASSRAA